MFIPSLIMTGESTKYYELFDGVDFAQSLFSTVMQSTTPTTTTTAAGAAAAEACSTAPRPITKTEENQPGASTSTTTPTTSTTTLTTATTIATKGCVNDILRSPEWQGGRRRQLSSSSCRSGGGEGGAGGGGGGGVIHCAFCKRNGETREFFTTHTVKDWRGMVVCPVLRAYTCPRCGSSGDHAHTESHCPLSGNQPSLMSSLRTRRSSCGRRLYLCKR